MQSMQSGRKPSTRSADPAAPLKLRLKDLILYRLGNEQGPNARRCVDPEFHSFTLSVVGQGGLEGEDLERWGVFDRRDFINWCLAEGLLEARDGVLYRIKNSDQAEFSEEKSSPDESPGSLEQEKNITICYTSSRD